MRFAPVNLPVKDWLFVILITFWGGFVNLAEDQKIVAEIEIRGLVTVSENVIKTQLETQVGKLLSSHTLRNDIQRLHALGYFQKIQVEENLLSVDGRVKVIFILEENQLFGEIYINGNFNLDKDKILDSLRINREKYLDQYTLALDILNLKEMYRKEGYLFADIQSLRKANEGWVDLYIMIDEGPKVIIREINFFGNYFFSKGNLLDITQTQESGLFSSKYYDQSVLQEDLILIRNFYRSEGFLDVQVELRDVFFTNDRTGIILNISIKEGPRYNIGKIVTQGNDIFRDEELKNRMELREKEPFQQNKMLQDKSNLDRLYGENGFLDVKIEPVISIVDLENPIVDVIYKIEEGSTTYIRKIDIKGNVLTRDDVIRRELLIVPGDLFNLGKVEESQQRIRRLQYFEALKLDFGDTQEKSWKDLSIKVEEGRTGSLRFAAGITSDLGAVGEISLAKRNFDLTDLPSSFEDFISGESFTGAGQNLDIFFQAGKEVLRFKVSFVEPYLLGYNLILGVDGYKMERARESWDEGRSGCQLSLGQRVDIDTVLRLSYRLEDIKIDNISGNAPSDVFAVKGKSLLSSLTLEFTIDTRDDFILPTRGYVLGASYEIAGVFLGGDYDYSLINLRTAWFQTLYTTEDNSKHVFSLGARVGFGDAHSPSEKIPIFERFFAGGSTSIRGFEFRTVGPKQGQDPIGGNFMILGTAEYGFPIYKDVMRGVLFTDIGNVTPSVKLAIFDDMRISVGFGFRLKVPLLGPRPFAFDFGFPIRKEKDDDVQVFSFSFGKPF